MDDCSITKPEWDGNNSEGVLLPQNMLEKLLWQKLDRENSRSTKCRRSEEGWMFQKTMPIY